MSKLTVEYGFNGVTFVKLDDKPTLSISSYGNRTVAKRVLGVLMSAPALVETLAGATAAMERALAALDAGQAPDADELRRWVDNARACLSAEPAMP
jgi:hypothetical protein